MQAICIPRNLTIGQYHAYTAPTCTATLSLETHWPGHPQEIPALSTLRFEQARVLPPPVLSGDFLTTKDSSGGNLLAMAGSDQIRSTSAIQRWLQSSATQEAHGTAASNHDVQASSETGLTSLLYYACEERLSLFCQSMSSANNVPGKARRSALEVKARFRLFGISFEHGKLESCLDDEEIFLCVLEHLVAIGKTLMSGNICPSYPAKQRLTSERSSSYTDLQESSSPRTPGS